MKTPLLALLTGLVVCAASAQAPRRSSVVSDLEAKVGLESAVEKRLQDVLRRMLGSDDVVVVVNADLLSDVDKPDNEILPGVSAKEAPGQAAALAFPVSIVRRVTVTILLDQGFSEDSVALAKKTASSMLGLKTERGDTLNIERMDFRKTPAPPAPEENILSPRTVWSAAWLLAAALGLLLVVRRFLEPLLTVLRDASDSLRASRSMGPGAMDPVSAAREEASRAPLDPIPRPHAAAEGDRVRPFAFLQERDVPTLVTLLENQSAQMTAVIVHFLPPAFASQALDAMPEARRKEIVSLMATPMLLDMTHVQALEGTIRASIDCLIGGEDKIADILTESPVRLQNELLAALRGADELLGERLARRLVVLDDISRLDDSGLTTLSRAVPLKSMAAALKTSPALTTHVLGRLKTGLGEWLKQEIDMAGELPEKAREAEVRRVVSALSLLVREGRVALRKGELPGKAAPANGNGSANGHVDAAPPAPDADGAH